MVSQLPKASQAEVIYPESDGKPIADNTKQLRWIVAIQQKLIQTELIRRELIQKQSTQINQSSTLEWDSCFYSSWNNLRSTIYN
jgi:hypothetical protein